MHDYIPRLAESVIEKRLDENPTVAILGPRQCGKSSVVRHLIQSRFKDAVFLDLEDSTDILKLHDPKIFFEQNAGRLICIDEVQNIPELFRSMRPIIDQQGSNAMFLVLGSASLELLQQTSESLAGRISYLELTPFHSPELSDDDLSRHWLRGGFPRSFLALSELSSIQWREDYILTFLQRDLPQLGFRVPSKSIERFWKMCAHSHGQILNASKLASSLGVSYHTIQRWVDILDQTFLLRVLQPFSVNLKKRLVKSPKIYVRDSGILHALLKIDDINSLLGHPVCGASWEGYVIENIITNMPRYEPSFYRTSNGVEIDLILEKGQDRIAIEIKHSSSPKLSRGFYQFIEDLSPSQVWVIAPVKDCFSLGQNILCGNLNHFLLQNLVTIF